MGERILITGITGQDGSYLAEYLLKQGYEVHGIIRKASTFNTSRIEHLYRDPHDVDTRIFLHYGDVTDGAAITNMLNEIAPDEVYHLAAQSHVRISFDLPIYTGKVTGVGVVNVLEALRKSNIDTKFYNAASSEMYGSSSPPQNETTLLQPRSPYAIAKLYAYWMTKMYRESYGMHACNGILFNHESPRRGETFVTRKITRAVARILAGTESKLYLGNLDAYRDWGYAPEYVEAMVRILRLGKPDDIVLGTGQSYSVRDFLTFCFEYVNLDWNDYVEIDSRYFRPSEVEKLSADISKAQNLIDWKPKILAPELAKIMVDYDMLRVNLQPPGQGIEILTSNGFNWVSEANIKV